tara:strand:- start:4787 stop:5011 length:225 start_codon:yes stop_codon:yes gene_type:complete
MGGKVIGEGQRIDCAEDVHRKVQEWEMWKKYHVPEDAPITTKVEYMERVIETQFRMIEALALEIIREREKPYAF